MPLKNSITKAVLVGAAIGGGLAVPHLILEVIYYRGFISSLTAFLIYLVVFSILSYCDKDSPSNRSR